MAPPISGFSMLAVVGRSRCCFTFLVLLCVSMLPGVDVVVVVVTYLVLSHFFSHRYSVCVCVHSHTHSDRYYCHVVSRGAAVEATNTDSKLCALSVCEYELCLLLLWNFYSL